jgi:phytoene/squalene synthetase
VTGREATARRRGRAGRAVVPFVIRRPWLITREMLRSREDPDLAPLEAIADPDTFVWRILPHAARTFAASITLLPAELARAAAIGYLYCRILDTYEDLLPEPVPRDEALARFGGRFRAAGAAALAPAPALPEDLARDRRDRTHVLLVNRCHLLDEVFRTLAPAVQRHIGELVAAMADGMLRSSRAFADQGGVLADATQLSQYCRDVIGLPFLLGARLLCDRATGADVPEGLRDDCLAAGEMVQLANITRDIEKDLGRGIAYHPALKPDLGRSDLGEPALARRVRDVREELLLRALRLAPAYDRMMQALPFPAVSLARASGVLMLLFTDRYYRSCARRVGKSPWPGPEATLSLMLLSFGHTVSRRWSRRTVSGVASRMVQFAG